MVLRRIFIIPTSLVLTNGFEVTTITMDYHPDLCLDLANGDASNGAILQLWKCVGSDNQNWVFSQAESAIKYASNTNMCADTGGVEEHAYLQLWECNGLPQQVWGYDASQMSLYLTNSAADASLCMQNEDGGITDGTRIIVSQCSGLWDQLWKLTPDTSGPSPPTPVPPPPPLINGHTFTLVQDPSYCLDLGGASIDNGTPIQLWECIGSGNQKWDFVNGQLVTALSHDKCVDAGNLQDGFNLMLWDCGGWPQQLWAYDSNTKAVFLSQSQEGLCMDIPGNSVYNGAQLQVWDCYGGDGQQFALQSFEEVVLV